MRWITAALLFVELTSAGHAASGDWTMDGHTYDAQRYSPLTRINEHNVDKLGLQWFYDLDTLHHGSLMARWSSATEELTSALVASSARGRAVRIALRATRRTGARRL
jgi:hypothetical protein